MQILELSTKLLTVNDITTRSSGPSLASKRRASCAPEYPLSTVRALRGLCAAAERGSYAD